MDVLYVDAVVNKVETTAYGDGSYARFGLDAGKQGSALSLVLPAGTFQFGDRVRLSIAAEASDAS